MKLKLFVILLVALGYLAVMLACNIAPPTAALIQESNTGANSNTKTTSNANANSNTAATNNSNTTTNSNTAAPNNSNAAAQGTDGVNPPHAVDISGKPIPESSTAMPDKPIILAKDSRSPIRGELKPEAAFDHVKHTTDLRHSLDGKTPTACVECHHTDQPSAPKGQEYLKRFERKEVLTAKQLEGSKQPVKSCRVCHFQEGAKVTVAFPSVTYPKEMKKPAVEKLTNEQAYHINCRTCHEAAKKRDPTVKAPQTCVDCHSRKP
ncbi:MAG: cytochrome c3 family protein [Acidobacteria bacterium]|nr:cytochrome c3 family protein [Acidobacteriota bacterium]